MNVKVEFDPRAELEYADAFVWYEESAVDLGYRFKASMLRKIDYIVKYPNHFPLRKNGYRECKIDDFPYLIIYKSFPEKNLIYIFSIFHIRRSPRKKYFK